MHIKTKSYEKIKSADYIDEYKIHFVFKNGKQGIIDFSRFPERKGIFKKLSDLGFFKEFTIDNGVITWGNGELDIAPETLYHLAIGEPYPDWLEGKE